MTWLFDLLALISCIAFVDLNWGKSYPDHEVLDTVSCNVYVWFGTLGVLSFMKKWGDFQNSFFVWMCKKSWGLYIFHYLCIAVSAWYVKLYLPQTPAILVYFIVGLAGFAGALLLNEIICRIPVVRWCVLGINKGVNKK